MPLPRIIDADIKLLCVFKVVAKCGGIAAAESTLNIGRSTISKYLADLEHRLGLRLCDRGPAGFALTKAGERVLAAGESLLAAVGTFQEAVSEVRRKLTGNLRVALFDQCDTNPEAYLPVALRRFHDQAPSVEIELSIMPPDQIETHIHGGLLDVGILAIHRKSANLNFAPAYGENMFLYCGYGHSLFDMPEADLTPEAIRGFDYAGINVNSPNLHFGRQFNMHTVAHVQNEKALAILILSGRYIGFLPDHMALFYVEKGKMKRLLPETLHYRTEFSIVTRRFPKPNRRTRLFCDILRKEIDETAVPARLDTVRSGCGLAR